MTTTQTATIQDQITELKPSYKLPLAIVLLAIPVIFLQPWVSLGVALFGIFLFVQAATLRFQFTPTALDIYRSGKLIRSFPYADWENWLILWSPIPIWFYFKEVNSIHSFPIIFDSQTFRSCLEKYCPKKS